MKCEYCFSEWKSTLGTIQVLFCPFCHNPLIDINEKFNSLEDTLVYLTEKYGIEILHNKRATLRFIEYCLLDGKREYNLMNMIYEASLLELLYKICNASKVIQNNVIKQVTAQLCDKYGVAIEWAEYIVGCICKCLGINNDLEHSIIRIKKMAEQDNAIAQFELAEKYHFGENVERNQKQYLQWLERSANNGYSVAKFQLGKELWNGINFEKNEVEAIRLLVEAGQSGNEDAICLIASDKKIRELSNIAIEEMVQQLTVSKDRLSVQQLLNLSTYYVNCNDVKLAINLAKSAYEKNEKLAWKEYVRILQLDATYENKAIALKVLRSVGTNGDIVACKMLGNQYETQATTESDMRIAIYWYRIAADSGDVDTQVRLAQIYEQGIGIQKDMEKAIYWYRIAAYNNSDLAKSKVSYKSKDCIVRELALLFDDGSEEVYEVKRVIAYKGEDYLVIFDSEIQEEFVVRYIENNTIDGFDIKEVEEDIENTVLQIYNGGMK